MNSKFKAYLDELRESGEINMFEAVPFLMSRFFLTKKEAREVLTEWMDTYKDNQ